MKRAVFLDREGVLNRVILKDSYMVEDRWGDIKAGFEAGCKKIFIDYNYNEKNQ